MFEKQAGGTPHIPIEGKTSKVGRVGTPHMKMCSDVHHRVGTPHMKMCSDVHLRMGTPHIKCVQMFIKGWVGGWLGVKMKNHATSWLHLASWNLPDPQPS